MKEPTKEQVQKFWEWCGFTLRCPPEKDAYGRGIWNYPEGTYGDLELDLNNLFKYAVPKLLTDTEQTFDLAFYKGFYWVHVGKPMHRIETFKNDPSLALFWAIWEVIKKEKTE